MWKQARENGMKKNAPNTQESSQQVKWRHNELNFFAASKKAYVR